MEEDKEEAIKGGEKDEGKSEKDEGRGGGEEDVIVY